MARELIRTSTPFVVQEDAIIGRLHCEDTSDEVYERCMELLEKPENQPSGGFIVREYPIDGFDSEGFTVGGERFRSKISAELLKDRESVFVYIATCGRSISEQIDRTEDPLDAYILDQIAYLAYLQASDQMSAALEDEYGIERHVRLCPGSIIDWSVGDVKRLFPLLDGLYQQLDLHVLSSGLIDPLKSTSGMLYATEEEFESCSICPRANCENRKTPFDPELHETMSNL